MALTVYWTQFAENKLDDIFSYYESKAGIRVAQRLVLGIIEKSIGLENNSNIGQREPLLADRPQNFRYLVYKSYKIIYWTNNHRNRIEVVNVFDCRQNPVKMKDIK